MGFSFKLILIADFDDRLYIFNEAFFDMSHRSYVRFQSYFGEYYICGPTKHSHFFRKLEHWWCFTCSISKWWECLAQCTLGISFTGYLSLFFFPTSILVIQDKQYWVQVPYNIGPTFQSLISRWHIKHCSWKPGINKPFLKRYNSCLTWLGLWGFMVFKCYFGWLPHLLLRETILLRLLCFLLK